MKININKNKNIEIETYTERETQLLLNNILITIFFFAIVGAFLVYVYFFHKGA